MVEFSDAYNITLINEGGYVNDPDDLGGETYKGISRKFNPHWAGWVLIDDYKTLHEFPNNAYNDSALNLNVIMFYKHNYWDINSLDKFESQNIVNEIFDTGVNMGADRAAKFLQLTLNVLNKDNKLYDDVVEDGKIGAKTLKALNACMDYMGDEYIYKVLNILQGMQYINYAKTNKTQEKYLYGWLKRVTFIKK